MTITATLYLLCMDYHSGQYSRGYRLLCRLQRRMIRHGIPFGEVYDAALRWHDYFLYIGLSEKWGQKL